MSHIGWQYPWYPRAAGQTLFIGDSTTMGSGSSQSITMSYPAQTMQFLESNETMYNLGHSSQTVLSMTAEAASLVDPKYDSSIVNRLVLWGGINDLFQGADAATTYTRIVNYCTARRAVGFKVLTCTLMQAINGSVPNYDADRKTINANIRANWTTFADGLADVASITAMNDATNQTYFQADMIHLIDAGYELVAQLVSRALQQHPFQ